MYRLVMSLAVVLFVGCGGAGGPYKPPAQVDLSESDQNPVQPPIKTPDLSEGAGRLPGMGILDGTRLKWERGIGEDGSEWIGALMDTKYGLPCTFQQTTERGNIKRCLPGPTKIPPFYFDAQCSQPLFVEPRCTTTTTNVIIYLRPDYGDPMMSAGCRGEMKAATTRTIARFGGLPATAYTLNGSFCDPVRILADGAMRYFVPLDEIPLTDFVKLN